MKKIALLGLILAMLTPAFAEITVDNLTAHRVGGNVNVIVTIRNPGNSDQSGPVVIDLFGRRSSADEWTRLTTWTDIKSVASGFSLTRDYFDVDSRQVDALASGGKLQLKATVQAPGLSKMAERTAWLQY